MTENHSEKEISLLDLLTYTYLFFARRWKLIIIVAIIGVTIGLVTNYKKLNVPHFYTVKIKIFSNILRADIIENSTKPLLLNTSSSYENIGFTKDVANQILSFTKLNENAEKDTSLYLMISFKDDKLIEKMVNQLITVISSQEEIKKKINQVEKYRTEYLTDINEKIAEIENYNKQIIINVSGNKASSILSPIAYSSREYFLLIEKKFLLELNNDAKIINYKILSIDIVKGSQSFKKGLLISIVFSLFFSCFIGFAYDLFLKVRKHAKTIR